ncbi:MAG TPA: amino-acid N-acetyltransferase [Gammaproteobacteria bacterium]|nr:amino-acid N-acetyltransferase [Gammaproteobacteria bacterium]
MHRSKTKNQLQANHRFVSWFRNSSPYINAFRSKTFVISFSGELLQGKGLASLIQDIALLNSLGIRLILVYGLRPQIDQRLMDQGIEPRYHQGIRITDDVAQSCIREISGAARITIESLLSMGLANTPMSGADIKVISGNFITARPLGIIDGVDFQHTGQVRRIDRKSVEQCLANDAVVMLPPLGFSPSGEFFNLSAHDVATSAAIALGADKLILLVGPEGLRRGQRQLPRELTLAEAEALVSRTPGPETPLGILTPLHQASRACRQGVTRAHILDENIDGALLLELFTRDGSGVMISTDRYEDIRHATIDDVGGILKLITPLEERKVLVRRSREELEISIDHFVVAERDGMIIACGSLYPFPEENVGEISCLAVHDDYQGMGYGNELLTYMESRAKKAGLKSLFVLTTQAPHWFRERGFNETSLDALPLERRQLYNYQRNSLILIKGL